MSEPKQELELVKVDPRTAVTPQLRLKYRTHKPTRTVQKKGGNSAPKRKAGFCSSKVRSAS